MSKKKTVVELYKEILAIPTLTAEQKEFISKRIEITEKKNASGKNAEPTPKRKAQLTEYEVIENAIVGAMVVGHKYTPTELLKIVPNLPDGYSTQKLTPRLTALVTANRLTKDTVKGRNVYSLAPSADTADEDTED